VRREHCGSVVREDRAAGARLPQGRPGPGGGEDRARLRQTGQVTEAHRFPLLLTIMGVVVVIFALRMLSLTRRYAKGDELS
jgi:hypothetical protein